MTLQISSALAITSSSIPPMMLIEKRIISPESLTIDETRQVIGVSVILTELQDYASADDKVGIEYVSKYYSYFCEHYDGYSFLPEGAKPGFQVANFITSDSFIGQAYSIAGCAQDYFDL